ncbi:Obg family GTPase CgtA [Patescibacteria group bacterium]
MLVDEIEVEIRAGDGGEGSVSFGKMNKSGPDGGNGGKGGDVYVVGNSDLTLLAQFLSKNKVAAEDGINGRKDKKTGANGHNLTIKLPIGCKLTDLETNETFEIETVGQKLLLCRGGDGGTGNYDLRSSRNTTPTKAIDPGVGQVRNLQVVLRFTADFGLIGLPSSGKSSLLNELTNAKSKTGEYHFTTLSPNLGVLPNKKIIADIPGLIEGAHEGKGLGIRFLKHIQKVGLLLHCISCDSVNVMRDYEVIRNELVEYDKDLLKKKEIIVLTKTDLSKEKSVTENIETLTLLGKRVVPTSIYSDSSIKNLAKLLE